MENAAECLLGLRLAEIEEQAKAISNLKIDMLFDVQSSNIQNELAI